MSVFGKTDMSFILLCSAFNKYIHLPVVEHSMSKVRITCFITRFESLGYIKCRSTEKYTIKQNIFKLKASQ